MYIGYMLNFYVIIIIIVKFLNCFCVCEIINYVRKKIKGWFFVVIYIFILIVNEEYLIFGKEIIRYSLDKFG